MSEPKYKIGDDVYYFDSFISAIVCSKVKSYKEYHIDAKTPRGAIIKREYFVGEYELSNGVLIKEHILFDDPMALIDRYLILFDEFRRFKFDGIY